jgi:hypothetical protein
MNVLTLYTISGSQGLGKGAVMTVSSSSHFIYQGFVPHVQGLQPATPPSGLGMVGISLLPFCQYGPNGMEFPVLANEMLTTQFFHWNIPNPHTSLS